MSRAMNVRCKHSLPVYIPEWKGRIIVQAPSFQKMTVFSSGSLICTPLYTFYVSSYFTFHLIRRTYNYSRVLISCQNHVFHFLEIDQFGGAKIKRNSAHFARCLDIARQCI
jgi:hypothetical protein